MSLQNNIRFEALFENTSLGILVVDATGTIILVNKFIVGQFGYNDEAELIGSKIERLIPGRFHHSHEPLRNNFIHHPKRRPMGIGRDLYGLKKDGTEIPVEVSLSHYVTEEGTFVIAFISDISQRKAMELTVLQQKDELEITNRKIEELNDELEKKVEIRTQQLNETLEQLQQSKEEITKALSKEKELSDLKSRFVSMASHEFRTPLSTILSSASLVAKYPDSSQQENREKHIQRIKNSVNNLTDLLNEFLSMGKIEDGRISAQKIEFNIRELLHSICNELQTIAKKGQQIQHEHTGNELVVLDPHLLRNAIINLLSNAIKFSPENETILISSVVTDNQICITVKDKGIGISKEDQEHLFERFFRGNNVTNIQGTGLGLHIVSKYVELMEGDIQFSSELEKGTEFMITFNREENNAV